MTTTAFIELAQALRPQLQRVGRSFFGNAEDADDVAQETLLRMWLMRDRLLAQHDALVGLACRMAKNVCIDLLRRQQLRTTLPLEEAQVITSSSADRPDYRVEWTEGNRLLQQSIACLSPSEQRLFLLSQRGEMDIQQIALVTGLQPRSVSAILSKARRKLFTHLKQQLS